MRRNQQEERIAIFEKTKKRCQTDQRLVDAIEHTKQLRLRTANRESCKKSVSTGFWILQDVWRTGCDLRGFWMISGRGNL